MDSDYVSFQRRCTIFKIPPDIEEVLQKKFPEYKDLDKIIHEIFVQILGKCFEHGSCTIREFGKFDCFKIFSSRTGRDQVRLKFKATSALIKKITDDSYLLNRLVSAKSKEFTDEHRSRCEGKEDQKKINYEVRKLASSKQKTGTDNNLAKQTVLNIIDEGNDK